MLKNSRKESKTYFRLEVLIPLLLLLLVGIYELTSQTKFKVIVDGHSMTPTYLDTETIWATSFYPRITKDDVVIFDYNNDILVKRIRFTPGDEFWAIFENELWEPVPTELVDDLIKLDLWHVKKFTVPLDSVWLEGDNKKNSEDSREYGFVNVAHIRGLVVTWRVNQSVNKNSKSIVKLYNLRKAGKAITKENFIKYG